MGGSRETYETTPGRPLSVGVSVLVFSTEVMCTTRTRPTSCDLPVGRDSDSVAVSIRKGEE